MFNEFNFQPFTEPVLVTEQIWAKGTSPFVSIITTAYNHELYIRDCIEGFLIQKTTFPVEFIIHDDASTDRTAEIIKEYENKYPSIIKPIYQSENQYSKNVNLWNYLITNYTEGKYIAICEGDDYWIDPLKLQKQTIYLENNKEYGLIHTNIKILQNNKLIETDDILKNNQEKTIDLKERILIGDYIIRTASTLFQKNLFNIISNSDNFLFKSKHLLMVDTPLWVESTNICKIKFLDDITTVYRITENSASHSKSLTKTLQFQLSMYELRMYFCQKYKFSSDYTKKVKLKYTQFLIFYLLFNKNFSPIFLEEIKSNFIIKFFINNKITNSFGRLIVKLLYS